MEIILWWFTAMIIIFVFFGGLISVALASLIYFINVIYFNGKTSKLIIVFGFLSSGLVSYGLCRYAMGGVELSLSDTAVAIFISLVAFTLTISFLHKRSFP